MALFTFVNGTDRQKFLWEQGAAHLLNMPVDRVNADITVEFVDPSSLNKQTTLAETNWTYDDIEAAMEVRNDFPNYEGYGDKLAALKAEAASMGIDYSEEEFAIETSGHELGHALFAMLPHSVRVSICELFGVETDDGDVINDESLEWQDRIIEGIAETFKEAFIPAAFRVFPNRTRRTISYRDYPQFRRYFRSAAASGFSYVYGSDSFRVDLSEWGLDEFPYHESDRDDEAFVFYQEINDYETCYGVDMSQFAESSEHPFSIEPEEEIIG